jgi:uncharacterized protein (TIGR00369 family)
VPPADRRAVRDFAGVPINRLLGLELRESSREGATVVLPATPSIAQEYGVVHGGILTTLADTAAVRAVQPQLEAFERITSIELKVNFLAGAAPDGAEIVARATVLRRGRTIAVAQVDVDQGGRRVLTGLFTYLVMRDAAS